MVDGKNVVPEVHAVLDQVKSRNIFYRVGCLNNLVQGDYASAVALILYCGRSCCTYIYTTVPL